MDGFNKKFKAHKQLRLYPHHFWPALFKILFVMIGIGLGMAAPGTAEEPIHLAVMPFEIHAVGDLTHLREDLQVMFNTQLAAQGFKVIDPETIKKYPEAAKPLMDPETIANLGRELGADYLISGSLTQIGKKVSLDLKALDVKGIKAPVSIFIVEDQLDKLKEAVNKAVKGLYNEISGLERIDSIKIKGNKRVETEAIMAVITSRPGEVLDYDQLDKDLRAIYAMGFFNDVRIETENGSQGKIVIFNVVEKPSIGAILFRGNKKIKQNDLRKELGIKPYAILNQGEIKQAVNRLKEYYREKGYYDVQITDKIEEKSNNEVTLILEIIEDHKVYIKKIVFVGNAHFSNRALRDVMETKKKGLLSFMFGKGLLDKKKLETDLQRIILFYHNHGYIRVKTLDPQIVYDEKEKGLKITIEIVEGPQYMVNEVSIEGDLILPADELLEKTNIKKEKFFNQEVLHKDVLALDELYANEGFANVDIAPLVDENNEKYLIDIKYHINKGQKIRFERINITGNSFTRDKVIRRELRVNEGQYFNGKDMRKSNMNLHNLGFFEEVDFQTKKGSRDDLMILDVNVKERPTGSIFFGGGYSGYEKISGKVQIQEKNLFGRGQDLSASVKLGSRTTEYDIQFTEPWLFDKNLSAGIDLYKSKEEFDDYTKDGWGGGLRLKFPMEYIDEYTYGSVKYGFDNSTLVIPSGSTVVVADSIRQMEGRHITSSITLGLSRDNRDNYFFPRSGSVNSISYEYAGGLLGGDVAYDKWMLRSSWFFPTPWETAFMVEGRWGYVLKRADGILPPYQKFYLGGINGVRGFKVNSISPIDPVSGNKIGGEKMMIYTLEYRFPVYKRQGVTGVVFVDAGNVYTEDESFSFSNIKKSFGAGIRWYNPLFPIRLEYGRVISPEDNEPTGEWEFVIGQFF
jgi:outer membrane protein insertion porin family